MPDGSRANGADNSGADAVASRDGAVAGDCVYGNVAAAAGVNRRLRPVDGRVFGRGTQQQHGDDGKERGLHDFDDLSCFAGLFERVVLP